MVRLLVHPNSHGNLLFTLVLTLFLAAASTLHADTLPFVSLEFPPYNYKADGEVTGFTTDVVKHVVRQMGDTPTVKLLPWQRAQQKAAHGEYAGIFTFTKSVKRMRNFRYTAPVTRIKDVFFKRRNDTIGWRFLSDLSEYQIGASPYNYADVFLNAVKDGTLNVQVVHSETPEILHLRKLKNRRIDLAICELRLCQFLVEKHFPEFQGIDFLALPVGPVRTFHIGISREWPNSRKLTREFNRQLVRMASNGTLQSLYRKHFSGVRVHQPREDFLLQLANDLRIYAQSHSLPDSHRSFAEVVAGRLQETVNGHVQTLGWNRGRTFVAWVRNGQFRIPTKGSSDKVLASSISSSGQRGIIRKEGSFRMGLLTEGEGSGLEKSVLRFRAVNGKPAAGGYLLFDQSGVLHSESTGLIKGEKKLELTAADD